MEKENDVSQVKPFCKKHPDAIPFDLLEGRKIASLQNEPVLECPVCYKTKRLRQSNRMKKPFNEFLKET